MKQHIDKNITIEDLTTILPDSVVYLMKEGIRCLRCGEPIWGTLETAAKEKGFTDEDVERFVKDLREMM
jgi:methionine synthase II (cobalamin-independent)